MVKKIKKGQNIMYDLDKGFSLGSRPIGGPELSEEQASSFLWFAIVMLLLSSQGGEMSPAAAKGLLEVLQRGESDNPSVSCADSSLYTREP